MKQRLSSLRALIFMTHGNFDTEKVSVTFSCVRIFYFSRKLQSGNDLINACLLGCSLRACQFGGKLPVRLAHGYKTQREIEGEMQTTHPLQEQGQISFFSVSPQQHFVFILFMPCVISFLDSHLCQRFYLFIHDQCQKQTPVLPL